MNRHGYPCRITMLGVEDRFVAHGTVAQLKEMCGYDAPGILRAIREAGAERLTSPIDGRVTEQAGYGRRTRYGLCCVSVPERE